MQGFQLSGRIVRDAISSGVKQGVLHCRPPVQLRSVAPVLGTLAVTMHGSNPTLQAHPAPECCSQNLQCLGV